MKHLIPFTVALALVQPAAGLSQSSQGKAGKTAEVTIPSKTYPRARHAWVYTPVGYAASCRSACNLMVVFDGAIYLGEMPLPQILDSLIAAKRTPPTVAILFDNGAPRAAYRILRTPSALPGSLPTSSCPERGNILP